MHQTPNSNDENSAPKAAHPESHIVKLMSVGSPTFSSLQEPIKDEDSLHKGRKRKATTQAVQISPICHHEIENIHTTELPSACQYVKDRLTGKITCMVCGKEGHYTCDCPMKDQEEKVICTLCNKVGHCHLWCCRQNVSENHACHRCGEKGHYANKKLSHFGEKCSHNREISCSSCDTNHLLGDCPMGKITCFLCEGKHHVPAQCRLSPILTIATQYHRESLRATLNKLMTETSSGTLTPVKPSRKLPHHEAVPKVSNFSSSNGQGHSAKKKPMRSEVTDSDKTNQATMKNKAAMLASKITCFNCHEEGHVVVHRMTDLEPAKPTSPVEEYVEIQGRPSQPSRSQARMQNIVNLVMWRDVSKSALVFGLGTFLLISSSYAKDLNFNTITAASYAGLIYLGLRFLRKSILNRGENLECDDEGIGERCYLVGEEEAIWLLRLVLPYINEVLLNLRSLFSGEPVTTMKLALLLFAMARCGNFITLWTLAKLVFFGVFIIPKVCSSYSTQLARYGKFWLERLRDAWESCSHKKAVVAAVFTLVWNVSSTVARVWAVFMLVVAIKCYQQRMVEFGWSSSTVEDAQESADNEAIGEEPRAKHRAQVQEFGAPVVPRHRRGPVSSEFARERLRVRGGIQPR